MELRASPIIGVNEFATMNFASGSGAMTLEGAASKLTADEIAAPTPKVSIGWPMTVKRRRGSNLSIAPAHAMTTSQLPGEMTAPRN
jgi:hypothetical protein